MAAKTSISWTDATWTPIRARVKADADRIAHNKGYTSLRSLIKPGRVGPHCEHVSPGCENCYSETNNGRCLPTNGTGLPFDRRSRELVDIFLDEKILEQPLHWRKPRMVFVCSQTDLFGEFVSEWLIEKVFRVMLSAPQHTYQILTKRVDRMKEWVSPLLYRIYGPVVTKLPKWIWLGVSVEDQQRADERIPLLLETPAAVRFISYEPALGPVDLTKYLTGVSQHWSGRADDSPRIPRLDWVIAGGESGPGARPSHPDWFRSVRDQCQATGVAFHFKQWGEYGETYHRGGYLPPSHREPGSAYSWGDREYSPRVGKKAAGCLLDGRTWDEFPEARG